MKHYKDYDKNYIGESDIARLILSYPHGVSALNFGEDGIYCAYIVDGDAIIGDHYKKVLQAEHWLKIYDDMALIQEFKGNQINIYRAGGFGCIIQIIIQEIEEGDTLNAVYYDKASGLYTLEFHGGLFIDVEEKDHPEAATSEKHFDDPDLIQKILAEERGERA